MLSNIAPILLLVLVFLAINPSKISVIPQHKYKPKNTIENGVVTRLGGDNAYNMNLLYTGDVFKAYYCEELGWNETNYNNWFNQNEESVTQ